MGALGSFFLRGKLGSNLFFFAGRRVAGVLDVAMMLLDPMYCSRVWLSLQFPSYWSPIGCV